MLAVVVEQSLKEKYLKIIDLCAERGSLSVQIFFHLPGEEAELTQ